MPFRLATLPHVTRTQREFLEEWTWFDSLKARNLSAQGDAVGAGECAASAAHDVLHEETLYGLLESMAADAGARQMIHNVAPEHLQPFPALVDIRESAPQGIWRADQFGGTSRKGNLCTLRRAGGVSWDSERSEASFGNPLIGVPGVIAREIDVLPAKRRNVLEQGGIELP